MKRAFSLLETLVAITIILLITAIVFPVLANARRSGYRAESMSNLKQIGMAIEMYRNDSDGAMPFRDLDLLVESGYLKNRGILISTGDAFKDGYGFTVSGCVDTASKMQTKTTYETLLKSKNFYDHVKSIDPDAAIVVDRTHGKKFDKATQDCKHTEMYYSGLILRMYEDTSVRAGDFSLLPDPGSAPETAFVFSRFRLFSPLKETTLSPPAPPVPIP